MIEGLKPYAEYKESGSRWLGLVPAHWEVLPLGRVMIQRLEQNKPIKTKNILSLSLRTGVIPYSEKPSGGNKAKDDLSAYILAYPGDIVLNSMNVVVGSVGLSKYFGAVSPVYYVLFPRNADDLIEFFDTIFQDSTFQRSLWGLGNGILVIQSKSTGKLNTIRMRIPMNALRRVQLPYPGRDEQAAIVRFLDHANRKIDRFIRAKRKLIALLGEQKQVIIHHAVTRGLDPNVSLKPSGISWLGNIPAHWEAVPLKGVCSIQSGVALGKTYTDALLAEFPYVRVANVQAGRLSLMNIKTLRIPASEAKRSMLQVGDVLMTEGGDPDKLGRGCVWNGEVENCIHQNHVFAVRPSPKRMRPQYLAALLESHYAKLYFLRTAKQTTNLASTNKTTIGQFRLPLPSLAEQDFILMGLATELESINSAIARTEKEIALMQEYRTRLTADIVTGKLDVREAAAKLPDLPSDVESTVDEALIEEPELTSEDD